MAKDRTERNEAVTPQATSARSARLGDRVFLWMKESGGSEIQARPATLVDYSPLSKQFGLVVLTPRGTPLYYPLIPWSAVPAEFHWTFEDQVEPIPVQ